MPWEQRSREPAAAHSRFIVYLNLGATRSLAQAAKECGLSPARLKQVSSQWNWPSRAAAWDRHQHLQRRGREVQEAQQARQRLLREAADWQSVARKQIASWVRRGSDGQLRLTRELTPSEALRLWRVGCQAELERREIATAGAHGATDEVARNPVEEVLAQMHRALDEASHRLMPRGADYRCRPEIRSALWHVTVAWIRLSEHTKRHGVGQDTAYALWPWQVPFEQA